MLCLGLLAVPIAVYWVGQQVVGEYASEEGLVGLIGHIWSDLAALRFGAWLLVLSPYLIVVLIRLALYAYRTGRDVTRVTESEERS